MRMGLVHFPKMSQHTQHKTYTRSSSSLRVHVQSFFVVLTSPPPKQGKPGYYPQKGGGFLKSIPQIPGQHGRWKSPSTAPRGEKNCWWNTVDSNRLEPSPCLLSTARPWRQRSIPRQKLLRYQLGRGRKLLAVVKWYGSIHMLRNKLSIDRYMWFATIDGFVLLLCN